MKTELEVFHNALNRISNDIEVDKNCNYIYDWENSIKYTFNKEEKLIGCYKI